MESNQWALLCAKRGTDHLGSAEDSPRLTLCERRAAWERRASWPRFCWDLGRIFGLFNWLPVCFAGTKVCVYRATGGKLTRCIQFRNITCKWPGGACGLSSIQAFFFTLAWVWRMPAWVGICTRVWFITSVSQRGCSRSLLHRVPTQPASFTRVSFARMLEMEWFRYETNGSSICSLSVKLM